MIRVIRGLLRSVRCRVIRPQPLDDLDPVAVRIGDEEAIRARDRRRLLAGDAVLLEMLAGAASIRHAQREVPRAMRIRLVLQQEMDVLIAEVEPEHFMRCHIPIEALRQLQSKELTHA